MDIYDVVSRLTSKSYYILYFIYIIKVEPRNRGCTTWFHQIVEILLDF